jgi:hypothetical protein
MSDKPAHLKAAEEVLKKVAPKTRERLGLTAKGSYTILADETSWIARITGKIVEFNKKRVEAKALTDAGMDAIGKDEFHRHHSIGFAAAPASGADDKGEAKKVKEPEGPGVPEVAKAVAAAAKPVPVKKAPKAEGKDKAKSAKGKAKKSEGNSAEFEAELAAEAAMNS